MPWSSTIRPSTFNSGFKSWSLLALRVLDRRTGNSLTTGVLTAVRSTCSGTTRISRDAPQNTIHIGQSFGGLDFAFGMSSIGAVLPELVTCQRPALSAKVATGGLCPHQ
ncbi:hypothetical protein MIND_00190700 [Mycena indigotica]|uniref:Uncharacterized protein n=1 Tax=Mycena indigotica TaxID=2126181 RepID=A0A8H6T8B5_9AGAR|nr:uncharacterized protein MIND_00190700 [Mycena indigotica]KAF7311802.1 hypothetical protein MIND_00190700 [Mycena indigotica]